MEKEMEGFVDHYIVLGLPSGEEGMKLSQKEISKAYKSKALDLHPDKRPDDPDARNKFLRLKTSFEVLKDENARKRFDDGLLRILPEKKHKKSQVHSKRRKRMSNVEERERFARKLKEERFARKLKEERITRKSKEQADRIRAKYAKKRGGFETPETGGVDGKRKENTSGAGAKKSAQAEPQRNILGAAYQAYEDEVMQILLKAAMNQK